MSKLDPLEETKRLMGALVRHPPKRHDEMKLGKQRGAAKVAPKRRQAKTGKEK